MRKTGNTDPDLAMRARLETRRVSEIRYARYRALLERLNHILRHDTHEEVVEILTNYIQLDELELIIVDLEAKRKNTMPWPRKIATAKPRDRPKKRWPTPTSPGFYWAKLIHPSRMPEGEDWRSRYWETVEVFENGGDEDGSEFLGVHVPGVAPTQWVEDFVWGPEIPKFTND